MHEHSFRTLNYIVKIGNKFWLKISDTHTSSIFMGSYWLLELSSYRKIKAGNIAINQ